MASSQTLSYVPPSSEAALVREEKRSRGVNSPTAHGRQGAPTKVILAHEALDSDTPGKAGP